MPTKDKEKNKEYQRKWYLKNKELQISRNHEIRKKKRKWLKDYKSKLSCIKCGENHPATLDFHHKDSETKLLNIARLITNNISLKTIQEEINKCEVLCSNCHRKLHYIDKDIE